MKIRRLEVARAIAALAIAIATTFSVAQFIGYPADPAAFHAQQDRIMGFVAANPVVTSADNDAFYSSLSAEPISDPPPQVIAIVQWLPGLFSGAILVSLLALRPGRVETAIVMVVTITIVVLAAGGVPGLALAAAFSGYLMIGSLFPGLRRVAAAA